MITRSQNIYCKSTQNEKIHHKIKNIDSSPPFKMKECQVNVENIDENKTSIGSNVLKTKQCSVVLQDVLKNKEHSVSYLNDLGNGSKVKIFKCKSARCGLKSHFLARDKSISSCTKRTYDCITPPGTVYIDCHSTNVIYLITCSTCGLQYVGETAQQLNARFTSHRAGIKTPDKHGTCKILSNHFNRGICKDSKYVVQILEKLEGSGRTERKTIDVTTTTLRRKREDYWMKTLRTVYPYGLNDRVGDDYMKDQATERIGLKFPTLKRSFNRSNRRENRKGHHCLDHEHFLKRLHEVLTGNIKEALNFIRISLITMKKEELKRLGDTINDLLLSKPLDFPFSQWYTVALDIVDCRIYVSPQIKKKRLPPSNVLHVKFCSKRVESVNLSSILHDSEVLETIPSVAKSFTPPTVVYSLESPISSKIFNFNKFVSSLDVDSFLKDNTSLPCSCENSPFSDQHHHHIISGDLRLIENNQLRKLFTKGPKYRERKLIHWDKVEHQLLESVKECAKSWCEKFKKSDLVLKPWISVVSEKIRIKISSLKKTRYIKEASEVLKSTECLKYLDKLQSQFVIVPIDKASGNIALVCKRFYAQVLIKELGLDGLSGSKTYEKINDSTIEEIIERDSSELSKKFGFNVPDESKKLPHIYWLPKLHKSPIKFRFIIAAPNCSIKPLSKAITKVFKLFYRQIETYNAKSYFFSYVKTFWVIQNNEDVINSIKKLNKRNALKSMATFDFSTLYTKIPHEKLLEVMNELVDFCFQGGTHEQLSLSKSGARWVSKNNRSGIRFSRILIKEALRYLMEHCYFTLGDKVFRQVIGIPMGSDPAPFMANLFLYHYESKWIKNLKKESLQKARRFSHTFRFIDDLLTINDNNLFLQSFKEIYPPELVLNLESSGDHVTFLDLDLTKVDGHLDVKLFDKRDDFPFAIVRLPFLSSNIPTTMFYSSIGAEIIRIGRVSSSLENFILSAKVIISRAFKQGANFERLSKTLKKNYGRQQVLRMFGDNAAEFVSRLLPR